jgi:hypothetical protein
MTDRDPLLDALARLDPTIGDPPPPPGSDRHRLILEHAMSATATAPGRRTRRRLVTLAGAGIAAAVIALVAVTVAGAPGDRPDPVAALTVAAETTGDVDTLRALAVYEDDGGRRTLDVDVDGRDYHLRSGTEWTITIGDQQWSDEDAEPMTVPDDLRNVPFPEASEAVLDAALEGATVTVLGDEDVRGVEATHYRIELGASGVAALSALAPNQVAMFELEYVEAVTSLDVWVADDLIRRIRHTSDASQGNPEVTIEFYDFGADITIEPPS